ncbi:hypothetical protein M0P25_05000 [archaeon]|jgi:hypothetical protein|nr:hypothetical protein [archaeon]MCK9439573.1 hypothetical protein [Patescibacteria group bacterium]
MTEYLKTIYPFNYNIDKKEIILPSLYPIDSIKKIKQFTNYKIIYKSNLYFEQMPIKDNNWRNLYAYFFSKKIKYLYRDLNKYIFYLDFKNLELTINKTKKELLFDFKNLKAEKSLKDYYSNYLKIVEIINLYSILDCCVVEEMGLFKIQQYCSENKINIVQLLMDLDSKKYNNYPKDIVKLYVKYIKPTKDFCWYFGVDLMSKKNSLIEKLEKDTKIKYNNYIINNWIPKISKKIIGREYYITK